MSTPSSPLESPRAALLIRRLVGLIGRRLADCLTLAERGFESEESDRVGVKRCFDQGPRRIDGEEEERK